MNRRKVIALIGSVTLAAGGSLGHVMLESDDPTAPAASTITAAAPPVAEATTTTPPPVESSVRVARAPATAALDYVDSLVRFDDETAHGLLCPYRRESLELSAFSASLRDGRLRHGMRSASVRDITEHVDAVTVLVEIKYDVITSTSVKVLVVPAADSYVVCDVNGPDQALDMVWPAPFRDT